MFIGEAPGAQEAEQGLPFVGPAGKELTAIYIQQGLGLERSDVFITNCVRFRPVTRSLPHRDRRPNAEELKRGFPALKNDIDRIRPKVIILLGNTAAMNLLARRGISKLRGRFFTYEATTVVATFHPAYLRRNRTKRREVLEDMRKVRDYLEASSWNDEGRGATGSARLNDKDGMKALISTYRHPKPTNREWSLTQRAAESNPALGRFLDRDTSVVIHISTGATIRPSSRRKSSWGTYALPAGASAEPTPACEAIWGVALRK